VLILNPFIVKYSSYYESDKSQEFNLCKFDYERDVMTLKSNGKPVIYSNISFEMTGSKGTAAKQDPTTDESTDRGGI
jgi:hypothetical protein